MAGKFTGTYYRSLDNKGRFLLPPAFLQALKSDSSVENPSFWLTSVFGRVTAYLPANWENTVEKLCSIPLPSPKLANFKTKVIGLAQEIIPDSQGRVRIPQSLIREGKFYKDVVLVGILDKFEIWDQELFDAIPDEDVSAELAASGISINL